MGLLNEKRVIFKTSYNEEMKNGCLPQKRASNIIKHLFQRHLASAPSKHGQNVAIPSSVRRVGVDYAHVCSYFGVSGRMKRRVKPR